MNSDQSNRLVDVSNRSSPAGGKSFLSDRRLVRELVLVVVIKIVLLSLIWWFFIRDQRVVVDAADTAAHIVSPTKNTHSSEAKQDGQ